MEERGESSEVAQRYVLMSTSSDASGLAGTGTGFGFDGKAET